jgi:hypothetical protein
VVNEHITNQDQLARKTKQERRERRRAKEKARIPQHGKSLARVYKDAVSKDAVPKRTQTTKAHKQSS